MAEENREVAVEDVESGGSEGSEGDSDSFIDDSEIEEASVSGQDDKGLRLEEPLSDKEIEELIAEFLEVESKAAEAQEALEKESLAKVESEVREELAQTLHGDDLETAVADEMATLIEDWKNELDGLETESAHLLEQLDGAGIELPSLYKWIESQAPNGCCTEAWKTRIHWVGNQVTGEFTELRADAEKYLQTHRPVRRKHGKLLEDGASGFLQKKLAEEGSKDAVTTDVDWGSLNKLFSEGPTKDSASFGSKHWASVYLASTPQQAAEMGLEFPGVNEVEEIDDIDGSSCDPFVAAAVANERELDLSEEHKKIYRKVKEEDDANVVRKLQAHLKQRRHRKRRKLDVEITHSKDNEIEGQNLKSSMLEGLETSDDIDNNRICSSASPVPDSTETRGSKRSSESVELNIDNKRSQTIIIDNDGEDAKGSEVLIVSSSDSDSDDSDAEDAISSTRKRKKKIRRIIDDAELGEETRRKIAIEKERQERMKSLQVQFSAKSKMKYSAIYNGNISEDLSAEVLGDASAGYIVNVMREKGEQPVSIPPSISAKLKAHQIEGVRFMWENIIQSVREVKSGDKGLGCILAHMMGLGKTFQVITFLYTAMRAVDLGLKTALIVTPVNVLHNWRQEFLKWRPSEVKPLRVFMLDDVTRERRLQLLTKWRVKGGVFLIGYTTFRILSLGKLAKEKDQHMAKEISHALHNGPDILVCDEAHIIKNTKAEITQALKQVRCQRRIALTGSPLQNNLMEYYCMVDFVREGFLGSSHEFRNRFQNPIENGQHTNSTVEDVKIMNQRSHILYEQLKGFVQRMDMSVVKKDLPPKTVFVIAVKLSPLQNKLYKRFLDLHGFTNGKVSTEKLKGGFFAGYQTLAQILNHPGILHLRKDNNYVRYEDGVENFLADESSSDENADFIGGKKDDDFLQKDWWSDLIHENNYKELEYSGKMVLLLEILAMCSNVGDKALVFSQSIPTLDLIELYISRFPRHGKSSKFWKKGKDWFRLDGKTESSERQKLVERFNDPLNKRVKCTLISTKAGSLGINLYAANRVVVVDGSWNPTYDLQAIYRAWRYGQTKPVFAYRLMAHKTIEEKIYKRQVTKEGLSARVVDRQQVHRTMSKEEMLHLFEFGDDESQDGSEQDNGANLNVTGLEKLPKHEPHLSHGTCSSDKMMEGLVGKHYPSLIANFHLHETLLQENEEEKLSKEEQDLAWQVYRKSFQWEEVQQVIPNEPAVDQKPATSIATSPAAEMNTVAESKARDKPVQRKCTRISHVLTLRSQGTKSGCTTVCGECAHEISWEGLNREGK